MTSGLVVWPEARADIREGRDFYEESRPGLGRKFLAAVRETLAAVEESPHRFPRIRGEVRRAPLRQFPYGIFYLPADRTRAPIVLACFHARRDPKVWQARLITQR